CYLRVLQWRSSRAALDWLIHWGNALPSRGLRELARDLLGRVAHKSGETVATLLREADPWVAARHFEAQPQGPLDGRGQERWTRHLEQTLLTGRSWSVDEFERLAASKAALLRGLIWLV